MQGCPIPAPALPVEQRNTPSTWYCTVVCIVWKMLIFWEARIVRSPVPNPIEKSTVYHSVIINMWQGEYYSRYTFMRRNGHSCQVRIVESWKSALLQVTVRSTRTRGMVTMPLCTRFNEEALKDDFTMTYLKRIRKRSPSNSSLSPTFVSKTTLIIVWHNKHITIEQQSMFEDEIRHLIACLLHSA